MKRSSADCELWFLFAHGAGASSQSAWMLHYQQLLKQFGPVESFDYSYMKLGQKRPDPLPRLLATHREALFAGKERHGERVVLVGKSMGGRIGCHLALEENVLGVICLGYPLRGMNPRAKPRDEVLLALEQPALFVQGTRDKLCPLDELRAVLEKRAGKSKLHVVETGDHSLTPTKTYLKHSGLTEAALEAETLKAVSEFLLSLP